MKNILWCFAHQVCKKRYQGKLGVGMFQGNCKEGELWSLKDIHGDDTLVIVSNGVVWVVLYGLPVWY